MAESSHWHRVQEVFDKVADCPPAERSALLAEACGDDMELRKEVESLLACCERTPADFMRPPEPPPGIRPAEVLEGPDPLIGTSIGRYRIKSVIGVGGMGTVYEAEQEQPRRIVALKVMNRYVASRSALRRFQFESEILAHLRHPNIAQVYEAGMATIHVAQPPSAVARVTQPPSAVAPALGDSPAEGDWATPGWPTSVPYFAMEYIPDAKTITQYAEENGLSTQDRLRLFAKVCDAVHHGHQKGIIHRDLKPANILVDSTGEPKVIDFGVARATDSDIAVTTLRTDVGQLIGTLQYMSPEQCDADPREIDTRSDVYSLGVVLYELLTGALPYDASGSTIVQAAQIIKEYAPDGLSVHNPRLRGDVETITLKALEKDREKRYQSAADLARDIERYLNREPISARPPTPWTQTVRWVMRHPLVCTTAACLAIGVLTVVATSLAIWILNMRPHDIKLAENGSEAQLISFDGTTLHTWKDDPHKILFAALVDRPDTLGEGPLAILAYHWGARCRFPGCVCAYEIGRDPNETLWHQRISDSDIPPRFQSRGWVAAEFAATDHCFIHEIFPEHAGQEIVAVFGHAHWSPRALCVYDLTGDLLYRVWHDGTLGQCHSMEDAGLLVLSGTDATINWTDGVMRVPCPDPPIVFALRPKSHYIDDVSLLNEWPDGHPMRPWYLYLRLRSGGPMPDETCLMVESPLPPHDPADHVAVRVRLGDRCDVAWVLDRHGHEVPGSRCADDLYKRNLILEHDDSDKPPDPNDFYLDTSPPMVTTSEDAAESLDGEDDNP